MNSSHSAKYIKATIIITSVMVIIIVICIYPTLHSEYIRNQFLQAVISGNKVVVCSMLKINRSLVNVYDKNGHTPLWFACKTSRFNIVKVLLSYGADPNAVHFDCTSPIFMVEDESIARLLIKHGADVNQRTHHDGEEPIHRLTALKQEKIIKLILHAGANVNAKTNRGATPLHIAARSGDSILCMLLLSYGAHVNTQQLDGDTALHQAVISDDYNTIQVLCKAGGNVLIKNSRGETAIDISISERARKLLEMYK